MNQRRTLLLCLPLLLLLFVLPAAAQSGTGGISGLVLQGHSDVEYSGRLWNQSIDNDDDLVEPTLTLIPIQTLRPIETEHYGIDELGRYRIESVPMGLYLLRGEAPGYQTWEAEVYVPSDLEARIYILLHKDE